MAEAEAARSVELMQILKELEEEQEEEKQSSDTCVMHGAYLTSFFIGKLFLLQYWLHAIHTLQRWLTKSGELHPAIRDQSGTRAGSEKSGNEAKNWTVHTESSTEYETFGFKVYLWVKFCFSSSEIHIERYVEKKDELNQLMAEHAAIVQKNAEMKMVLAEQKLADKLEFQKAMVETAARMVQYYSLADQVRPAGAPSVTRFKCFIKLQMTKKSSADRQLCQGDSTMQQTVSTSKCQRTIDTNEGTVDTVNGVSNSEKILKRRHSTIERAAVSKKPKMSDDAPPLTTNSNTRPASNVRSSESSGSSTSNPISRPPVTVPNAPSTSSASISQSTVSKSRSSGAPSSILKKASGNNNEEAKTVSAPAKQALAADQSKETAEDINWLPTTKKSQVTFEALDTSQSGETSDVEGHRFSDDFEVRESEIKVLLQRNFKSSAKLESILKQSLSCATFNKFLFEYPDAWPQQHAEWLKYGQRRK